MRHRPFISRMILVWTTLTGTLIMGACSSGANEIVDTSPTPTKSITPVASPSLPATEAAPGATQVPTMSPTTWIGEAGFPLAIDSQGQLMVQVPGGTFQMGLTPEQAQRLCEGVPPETEECIPDTLFEETPARTITLTLDFWIDVYEVTNEQYQSCASAGVCTPPAQTWIQGYPNYYTDPQFAQHPVVHINFEQAQVFCHGWRGGRLPTESEWEYAARGTDGRLWPWGNELTNPETLANVMTLEAAAGGYGRRLQEVGTFERDVSPFGLYDMAGNVMEWAEHDPSANANSPSGQIAAMRGGYSLALFFNASTATRREQPVDEAGAYLGFRCVRDIEE